MLVQFSNAELSIRDIDAGMSIDFSDEQLAKADSYILFSEFGNFIVFKFEHPANAFGPIDDRDCGSSICCRLVLLSIKLDAIAVVPSFIVMLLGFSLPMYLNAMLSI
jgi:hypothetical protein